MLLILSGEAIFFLPFVIVRIFRPTILSALELTNTQLGFAFSVYGILALISYFFGGYFADRFPAKNLISLSLISTALLGFLMMTIPGYTLFLIIYGTWGITTILFFWAPLMKATRSLGGDTNQGKTFGGLDAGRGAIAALMGTVMITYLAVGEVNQPVKIVQKVYFFCSIALIVIAFLVYFLLKVDLVEKTQKVKFKTFVRLLVKPVIWRQILFIFLAYIGYKITDDFAQYAKDIMGFNDLDASKVGTFALWLRPFAALSFGLFADKFSVRLMAIIAFLLAASGSLLFYVFDFNGEVPFFLVNLSLIGVGVYALRGLYFAIMKELDIPAEHTGSVVGLTSFVGFTPDIFMGLVMGYFLDTYPGVYGHQLLFLFSAVCASLGILNLIFFKTAKE